MKSLIALVLFAAFAIVAIQAQSELTPHERFWCYNYYQAGCDSEPRIAPEEKAVASKLEFGPYNRVGRSGYFVSYVGLELQDGCAPQEAGLVFTVADLQKFMNLSDSSSLIGPALVTPFFANSDRGRSFSNIWGTGIYKMGDAGSVDDNTTDDNNTDDNTNTTIPTKRNALQDDNRSHDLLFPFYFTSLINVYDVAAFNDAACSEDNVPQGFETTDRCMYRASEVSGDTSVIYQAMNDTLMYIAPATSFDLLDDMKRAGDAANTVIYHDFDLAQPQEYPDALDRDLVHKFPRGWEIFYIPDCKQFMIKLTNWQTVDLERSQQ